MTTLSPCVAQNERAVHGTGADMLALAHSAPGSHRVAYLLPAAQYDPAGHGCATRPAPAASQNEPAAHSADAAVSEAPMHSAPDGQGDGALEPMGQNEPVGHATAVAVCDPSEGQ